MAGDTVVMVESTILDAPVEEVWAVMRDFNGHDSGIQPSPTA